jgi:hypothetical protein
MLACDQPGLLIDSPTVGAPDTSEGITHETRIRRGHRPEGLGLAMRMAHAGHEVAIGSRSTGTRGERARRRSARSCASAVATGGANADVVGDADVVF